jgi:hypothetical protein
VFDSEGTPHYEIKGRWNESISFTHLGTNQTETVLTVIPKPEDADRQYGFDKFTMQLNFLDAEMKLYIPPTDSRYRPDQRYYEIFDIQNASKEKSRLEEKQREARKKEHELGVEFKPLWFEEKVD